MKFWEDPTYVKYIPIITTGLLEGASIGQMIRMVQTQSSLDQSLTSWGMVVLALVLWLR